MFELFCANCAVGGRILCQRNKKIFRYAVLPIQRRNKSYWIKFLVREKYLKDVAQLVSSGYGARYDQARSLVGNQAQTPPMIGFQPRYSGSALLKIAGCFRSVQSETSANRNLCNTPKSTIA